MFGGIALILLGILVVTLSVYLFVKKKPKDEETAGALMFVFFIGGVLLYNGGVMIDEYVCSQPETPKSELVQ